MSLLWFVTKFSSVRDKATSTASTHRKLVSIHWGSRQEGGTIMYKLTPACSRLLFSRCRKFSERSVPNYCRASQLPGVGARWVALLRGNLRGISVNAGRVINSHFLEIASWSWVQGRNNKVAPVQDFTFKDEGTDCLWILSCYVIEKKRTFPANVCLR